MIDFIAPFFILFAHIAIYMMIRRQRGPARYVTYRVLEKAEETR